MFEAFEGTRDAVGIGGNPFPVPERDRYWVQGSSIASAPAHAMVNEWLPFVGGSQP
jgi:hypothetical protein